MPLVPQPENARWLTGDTVEGVKGLIRETDATYLMKILLRAFGENGPMVAVGATLQTLCDQARSTVAQQNINAPLTVGGDSIWLGYNPDGHGEFELNIRLLATLHVRYNNTLTNPLAIGDVCRACADMISAAPNHPNTAPGLAPIAQLFHDLQNAQAFNKTTNRVRVKRRDILDQMPGVGGTQWYLPPEDVLGNIDRLLGYYETGDISGTTTDGLGVLAMLSTVNVAAIGTLDQIKQQLAAMVNNGLAFTSFAGMVVQMHHSLPECMMAINLMPRDLGVDDSAITQIYSPFLTNTGLGDINNVYNEWRQARYTALGGADQVPANVTQMLIVVQDIFQMPNRATAAHEVALILPVTAQDMTNNAYVFGSNFYNRIVAALNTANPGPAITLEKLSSAVFDQWFGPDFDPAIANPQFGPGVVESVQRGMALPANLLQNADHYRQIAAPFVGQAAYGQVEPAQVGNLN